MESPHDSFWVHPVWSAVEAASSALWAVHWCAKTFHRLRPFMTQLFIQTWNKHKVKYETLLNFKPNQSRDLPAVVFISNFPIGRQSKWQHWAWTKLSLWWTSTELHCGLSLVDQTCEWFFCFLCWWKLILWPWFSLYNRVWCSFVYIVNFVCHLLWFSQPFLKTYQLVSQWMYTLHCPLKLQVLYSFQCIVVLGDL